VPIKFDLAAESLSPIQRHNKNKNLNNFQNDNKIKTIIKE
jgi:hypothetical protein